MSHTIKFPKDIINTKIAAKTARAAAVKGESLLATIN